MEKERRQPRVLVGLGFSWGCCCLLWWLLGSFCWFLELRVTKQWNQAGKSNRDIDPGGINFTSVSQNQSFLAFCCWKPQNQLFWDADDRQEGAESNEAAEPKPLFSCFLLLKTSKSTVLRNLCLICYCFVCSRRSGSGRSRSGPRSAACRRTVIIVILLLLLLSSLLLLSCFPQHLQFISSFPGDNYVPMLQPRLHTNKHHLRSLDEQINKTIYSSLFMIIITIMFPIIANHDSWHCYYC